MGKKKKKPLPSIVNFDGVFKQKKKKKGNIIFWPAVLFHSQLFVNGRSLNGPNKRPAAAPPVRVYCIRPCVCILRIAYRLVFGTR